MKVFVQSMIVSAFLVLGACAPENGGSNNGTAVAAPPYPAPNGACGAYPYNGQQPGGQPMPAPNGGGYYGGGYYGNGYGTGGYPAGTNCAGGAQPMPMPVPAGGGYYGGGYSYGNQYYGNQYYGNQYYGYPSTGAGYYIQGQARWGY